MAITRILSSLKQLLATLAFLAEAKTVTKNKAEEDEEKEEEQEEHLQVSRENTC